MSAAISFCGVSKRYRLSRARTTLRDLVSGWSDRKRHLAEGKEVLWALRNINLQLEKGQVLGLIGPNGAGKSTLLKLTAGITRPTEGRIELTGRIGSLIELGAGFHQELTGRENVFLNGQIMGLSRREIQARYDEIVEFSGVADYMDVPVKRYSSGMYARLGFSVAAHMDPDILLVDEVLSVGDASFQRKSLDRMIKLVNSGKAVVFVSHNLVAVERMCDHVLWLNHGQVQAEGPAREVIQAYLTKEEERLLGQGQAAVVEGSRMAIQQVSLLNGDADPVTEFQAGHDLTISIRYRALEALEGAKFALGIVSAKGPVFLASMLLDGKRVDRAAGEGTIRCRFRGVPLMPGAYQVYGEVWGQGAYDLIVPWSELARFRVTSIDPALLTLAPDHSASHAQADVPVVVPYAWELD